MKRCNAVIQSELYSCGACCIESVILHYGGFVPHEIVIKDTLTDKTGTSAYNIVRALKKYGFFAEGLKVNLSYLHNMNFPIIAHTIENGYEHFVVIYKFKNNRIIVMNPRVGYKSYNVKDFEKIFTGVVISIYPTTKIIKYEHKYSFLNFFKVLTHKNIGKLVVIFLLNVVYIALSLLFSLYFKIILKVNRTNSLVIFFIFLIILKHIIYVVNDIYKRKNNIKIDKKLKQHFINKIFNIDLRYIINKRSGEVLKKFDDLSRIKDSIFNLFTNGIMECILFLSSTVALFIISKELCIFVLTCVILIFLLFVFFDKYIYYEEVNYNDDKTKYNGDFIETVSSIECIKNIHKEKYFISKLIDSYEKFTSSKFRLENIETIFSIIKSFLFDVFYIIIITIGVKKIVMEEITIGDLFVFNTFYSLLMNSAIELTIIIREIFDTRVILRDICDFLSLGDNTPTNVQGNFYSLKIINLSISYDGIHEIIKDFNCTIARGEKVIMTGPSGIGKSSIAKCISGLNRDYMGDICFNDTKNIMFKNLVYIGQNDSVVNGSVEENITLGNTDSKMLKYISKICFIDGEIKLNKYIVNNGENISKGQKARIILARALYLNPDVLIIDELLSSVSEEMEEKILSELMKLNNLTLIYITHRNRSHFFKRHINLERNDTCVT